MTGSSGYLIITVPKANSMASNSAEVEAFLKTLKHPLKAEVEAIRAIILSANKQITEHIKWNAPSFCYNGEDRVTMNLRPRDCVQLIFHRGAKVKDSKGFVFEDDTELIEWLAADRALVKLSDMNDVKAKRAALKKIVGKWVMAG